MLELLGKYFEDTKTILLYIGYSFININWQDHFFTNSVYTVWSTIKEHKIKINKDNNFQFNRFYCNKNCSKYSLFYSIANFYKMNKR